MLPPRTNSQASCLHAPLTLTDLHLPLCLNILQIALALAVHSAQAGRSTTCLHGPQSHSASADRSSTHSQQC